MISIAELEYLGRGLVRPECVVAHASGRLFVPDWSANGGVAIIEPDGGVWRLTSRDREVRPNGIALEDGGSFLLAHLGDDEGGVFRLTPDGRVDCVLDTCDGVPLPPTNFVHVDKDGRQWITVSTRKRPRSLGYRGDVADGFIILNDTEGARVVADGLGYTNECIMHPNGRELWVNETFARRLSAFDVTQAGDLVAKRTVTEFEEGVFPDGLAFDSEGHAWIVSIVSNRVIRVGPDGGRTRIIDDSDADHVAWVEAAFRSDGMGRPHLDTAAGASLKNISNIAFGGPDMKTAYLGCLLGDRIAAFRSDVAGHAPPHWRHDITLLLASRPDRNAIPDRD